MSIIERDLEKHLNRTQSPNTIVQEMRGRHGTRCLSTLIALLEDEDSPWSTQTLFAHYRLSSLVRATAELKRDKVVVCGRFLKKLENECFWKLTRRQLYRLHEDVLFLFPKRFEFLKRWIKEGL
jgi:hypothetical protein